MKTYTAVTLLAEALAMVESKSIREWAMSPRNRMIWREIAATAVKNGKANPENLCAYIVATAIGL